jgi:hypothetical protein
VAVSGQGRRARPAGFLLASALALSACTVGHLIGDDGNKADDPRNPRPVDYKSDIVAMLRVYLNNPTEIKDASVSEPMLQSRRYVVCLRLDSKRAGEAFSGVKEYVAVFLKGRLDQLIAAKPDQCSSADYQPFPEAETLRR